jgi:hypothetical protein
MQSLLVRILKGDPGIITGVHWTLFNPRSPSIEPCLRRVGYLDIVSLQKT